MKEKLVCQERRTKDNPTRNASSGECDGRGNSGRTPNATLSPLNARINCHAKPRAKHLSLRKQTGSVVKCALRTYFWRLSRSNYGEGHKYGPDRPYSSPVFFRLPFVPSFVLFVPSTSFSLNPRSFALAIIRAIDSVQKR